MIRVLMTTVLLYSGSRSACLQKYYPYYPIQGSVCDSISTRAPRDRMEFIIEFEKSPGNDKDSVHLAALQAHWTDLFSKYDLRSEPDTSKPAHPPSGGLTYSTGSVMIRKLALDSVVSETYVSRMGYLPPHSCSPKYFSAKQIAGTVCDSITVRSDNERMIFEIGIQRSPGNS